MEYLFIWVVWECSAKPPWNDMIYQLKTSWDNLGARDRFYNFVDTDVIFRYLKNLKDRSSIATLTQSYFW